MTREASPSVPGQARAPGLPLAAAIALLLAACAQPGPPPAHMPLVAAASAGLDEAAPPAAAPPRWWAGLGDAQLSALIDQALQPLADGRTGPPALQAAAARLAAADAASDAAEALAGPTAMVTGDAHLQRFSGQGLVPPAVAGQVRSTGTLQLSGRVALDFFGRHQAVLAQALGRQRAAAAEADALRLQLAGQLAQAWVALAAVQAQQQQLAALQALRAQRHALVARRVAAGLERETPRREAEATLADLQAQQARLAGQAQALRHRLALLSGQGPQALAHAAPQLQALRLATPPAHLGAGLLAQRADVAAARWRVQAALQGVAEARADFYPDINLNASVGLNALGLDRLLQLGSRQASIGPALSLPLFDGGALRARLAGRAAEADAAIAAYNAAVLDAAREVADAASSLRALEAEREALARQRSAAAASQTMARQRAEAGLDNRLPLLAADEQVLLLDTQAQALAASRLQAQVALLQALGGGWQAGPPPAAQPAAAAAPALQPPAPGAAAALARGG